MNNLQFYDWLDQRQVRLVELISEETEKATRQTGKPETDLLPRVQRWVDHFLRYVQTADFQIMIEQIETTNRQKLARGEKLNFESAEKQAGYILSAFMRLIGESELNSSEREWLSRQIERSMRTLNTNAKMVYSRLTLEQAQNAIDNS